RRSLVFSICSVSSRPGMPVHRPRQEVDYEPDYNRNVGAGGTRHLLPLQEFQGIDMLPPLPALKPQPDGTYRFCPACLMTWGLLAASVVIAILYIRKKEVV